MSLPRRVSKDPLRVQSVKKLSLEQSLLLWHLGRGGFGPDEIAEAVGIRVHQKSFDELMESMEWLVCGPIPLPQPIKCNECNSRITQVPCFSCPKKPNFSLIPAKSGV